ncbi:MAG TPA: integrase core domain-containing protein [Pseudonocardia sp.]|uniref:integrase core domain-containing protein n=1 Tax=Pseudonocardia sp. TaxID=60912 RepID=UPI002B9341E5|nr:integrase core domain-containing protein [Pseudonocardia sp.]HTF48281.1 integrase core domain-containing protein [Pseudonocardia sp.]
MNTFNFLSVVLEHVQGFAERIQRETVAHRVGATKLLVKGSARVLGTHTRAAPRANAIAERWTCSLRRECLDLILITGPRHLAHVLCDYTEHHNHHLPHRSLDQHPPAGRLAPPTISNTIRHLRRDRLGRLIHEYLHVA